MADYTLSALALATLKKDEIVESAKRESAVLRHMPVVNAAMSEGASTNLAWNIDGYGAVAQTFSEGGAFSTFVTDSTYGMALGWARLESSLSISGDVLRLGRAGMNPMQSGSAGRKMKKAMGEVLKSIGTSVFTGTAAPDIVGLDVAVHDSNTYAGIARTAANTSIHGNVIDGSGGLTIALVETSVNTVRMGPDNKHGGQCDVGFCSLARYQDLSSKFTRTLNANLESRDGAQYLVQNADGIVINGCRIFPDRNITDDGTIYLCTSDEWELVVQPPMGSEDLSDDALRMLQGEDGLGPVGLGVQLQKLPYAGDAHRWAVFSACQLRVLNPSAFGRIQSLPAIS